MRRLLYIMVFLFLSVQGYAQQYAIDQILEKSFIALADSILIKDDSTHELAVLYEMAKNKKIVAIGEVTHGTKEAMAFQKLIAANLVKRYGFKCIVLGEISLLDAYKVNDFVVNQRGSIEDFALKNKAQLREIAYRQEDLLALYSSISEYNKDKPFEDRVWIIGADIDEPKEVISFINAYCQAQKMPNAIRIIETLNRNLRKMYTKTNIGAVVDDTNQLVGMLEGSRKGIDSLEVKIDVMVHLLKVLPQLVAFSSDADLKYKMRDKFIFDNIVWLMETCKKDKLVIIKAHNFHVNRKTIYTEVFGKFLSFGEYLSREYQDDYLCIGTEVQQGRFFTGANTNSKIMQHKNKIGSIIGTNTKAQYGILFCDNNAKGFLNRAENTLSFGTVNYKSSLLINAKGMLGDAFDVLIFIRDSTPYGL